MLYNRLSYPLIRRISPFSGRPLWAFVATLLAVHGSGCATVYPKVDLREEDFADKPLAIVNDVPFIEQTPKLCGPSALVMAVQRLRPELTMEEATRLTYTPKASGSYKQDMLAAVRRLELAPYRVESMGQMVQAVADGQPVVVFHRTRFLWKDYWHYSVLTGYDRAREKLMLHIGPLAHEAVDVSQLIGSWEEGGSWAFVALPASELPQHASFQESLDNSLALLRLGFADSALALSERMRTRWPDRYEGDVIAAEAELKLRQPGRAIASLRRALRKDPRNAQVRQKLRELSRS